MYEIWNLPGVCSSLASSLYLEEAGDFKVMKSPFNGTVGNLTSIIDILNGTFERSLNFYIDHWGQEGYFKKDFVRNHIFLTEYEPNIFHDVRINTLNSIAGVEFPHFDLSISKERLNQFLERFKNFKESFQKNNSIYIFSINKDTSLDDMEKTFIILAAFFQLYKIPLNRVIVTALDAKIKIDNDFALGFTFKKCKNIFPNYLELCPKEVSYNETLNYFKFDEEALNQTKAFIEKFKKNL